jgi:uncharacterized protein (DUF924 family)
VTEAPFKPAEIVAFWRGLGFEKWFAKDEAFDSDLRERFGALHARAAAGELDDWATSPEGALVLLLLLDQFSRNIHRGTPQAFAQDEKARELARQAVAAGFDRQVEESLRVFFYLPFMHSESIIDQERSVALCHSLANPGSLPYARDHERIIRRFGRFPHRNPVLGRHTTPAERAFLDAGGFSG